MVLQRELPADLLTDEPARLISDPRVQLVVEVMGGQDPAGDLVLAALQAGFIGRAPWQHLDHNHTFIREFQ